MQILCAKYRIVTPLFIGDANQTIDDGIRPPSIKGMLRFWWRALNWGHYWQENQDETTALKQLHQEEQRLFGAAMDTKKKTGGQGCFLLSVSSDQLSGQKKGIVHKEFANHNASRYLGYGLIEAYPSKNKGTKAGELIRHCIDENQTFTVKLLFKKTIEHSVKQAVIALGLFGGLGSRTRHGIGSLSLENLTQSTEKNWNQSHNIQNYESIWTRPTTEDQYKNALASLLKGHLSAKNPAPYSCFDKRSRIDILDRVSDPYKALDNFATALLMYRSWGKYGKVLGQESEKNFKEDHDWSKPNLFTPANFHPKRAVFGLPHNYGKGTHLSITAKDRIKNKKYERRSSPLFLHIHQLSKHRFLTVSLFLPTLFLPNNVKIQAGSKFVDQQIDYDVITTFLDGKKKNGSLCFPKKINLIGIAKDNNI